MTSNERESSSSIADGMRDGVVQSADAFHVAREEARTAETEQVQASSRRGALLESLRQSARRVGAAGVDREKIVKKRMRIIRDGSAAEVESEALVIRRELQIYKHKGLLSVTAENLAFTFDTSLKVYVEKKKLQERLERTLESTPSNSPSQPDCAPETYDCTQPQQTPNSPRDKIVQLAGIVRNDVIRIAGDFVSLFEKLDTRIHDDIQEEEKTREFFYACIQSVDKATRNVVVARARSLCQNAALEKRCAIYIKLVEGLARKSSAVAQRVHSVAQKRARAFSKQNRNKEAADELFSAIRLWREEPRTFRLLVRVLTDCGDKERAFSAQRELLRLCPDDLQLRKKIATEWDVRGNRKKAIAAYEELVARSPDDLKSRRELARLLVETQAHARVPAVLTGYIEERPNDAEARLWMGMSLVLTEDWQAGIPHLKVSLDLGTEKWKPSLLLSIAYRGLELIDEAQQVIEACKDHPSAGEHAYLALGDILQERGKLTEAEAAYRKALEVRAPSVSLLLALGQVVLNQGKTDQAVDAYRKASQLDDRSPKAFLGLGRSLRKQGNYEDAESALKKAVELRPDDKETQQELSILYMETGQLELATEVLRALSKRPTSPSI